MSAVLDFRQLRDKVLAGEEDEEVEAVKSPMGEEVGRNQNHWCDLYFCRNILNNWI